MAGRDPTRPQLEFPELVSELISQLRLTGQVGRLNFRDEVIPAFLIGSRGINFGGDLPAFTSSAVFASLAALPAANTVVADTGPLPAGDYDMMLHMTVHGNTTTANTIASIEHRNAGNTASLAGILFILVTPTFQDTAVTFPLMGYTIGLNERIRCISPNAAMTAGGISCNMLIQIRPTP